MIQSLGVVRWFSLFSYLYMFLHGKLSTYPDNSVISQNFRELSTYIFIYFQKNKQILMVYLLVE